MATSVTFPIIGVRVAAYDQKLSYESQCARVICGLLFLLVTVAFGITAGMARRLEEPRAANVGALLRDMLAQGPLRSWLRFWPRA